MALAPRRLLSRLCLCSFAALCLHAALASCAHALDPAERAAEIRDEILAKRRAQAERNARQAGGSLSGAAAGSQRAGPEYDRDQARARLEQIRSDVEAAGAQQTRAREQHQRIAAKLAELDAASASLRDARRRRLAAIYRAADLGAGAAGWQASINGDSVRLARYLVAAASPGGEKASTVDVQRGSNIAALDQAALDDENATAELARLEGLRVVADNDLARAEAQLDANADHKRAASAELERAANVESGMAAGAERTTEGDSEPTMAANAEPKMTAPPAVPAEQNEALTRLEAAAREIQQRKQSGGAADAVDSDVLRDAEMRRVDPHAAMYAKAIADLAEPTQEPDEKATAGSEQGPTFDWSGGKGAQPPAVPAARPVVPVSPAAATTQVAQAEPVQRAVEPTQAAQPPQSAQPAQPVPIAQPAQAAQPPSGAQPVQPAQTAAPSASPQTRTPQAQSAAPQGDKSGLLSRLFGGESEEAKRFAAAKGSLAAPVEGKVVANFGQVHESGATYRGVIVRASRGSAVRSVGEGTVLFAGTLAGLGNCLIVNHGGRYHSVYARLDSLRFKVGQHVGKGDVIGTLPPGDGDLQFEMRDGGKAVDPRPWLRGEGPDLR